LIPPARPSKDGVVEAKADAIIDLMEKFAGYGFNK
jgi:DNA polymerase-3 subunit alpha